MLTSNAQQFRSYLQSQNINLQFNEENDGSTTVVIRETLKTGGNIRILVVFNKTDSLVSVYGGDFINGINPVKRDYVYEAINELNMKYTYLKFVFQNDSIMAQAFTLVDNNFRSEVIMDIILGMLNIIEEEYPKLMRIIWS
ncbi:YbjN domain-containing protein [Tepidimicrobium xylanilyticum]|uniref:Putative sensory transduction regulator n=1 Tax=Tepidimicrobium xylanilyticum TaxID=1123352 RepID=A0A1H2ZGA5_9FIRM|nr:YbjN domain-containing protein [Tepidimicrobium xylanilyticum]GMG96481.1 hypothetical protein EN5CB1_13070 [Tepidimicrobium xylanilyticum]SDX16523.1 Putative sensory transduction regulator [Tepidimicrobium xylanilyticum]